jgi:protein-L-isoaspartate(D-aspartate) O-methyltransferase
MVIPLGKPGSVQTLVMATKEKGKLVKKNLLPVRFVPFVRE